MDQVESPERKKHLTMTYNVLARVLPCVLPLMPYKNPSRQALIFSFYRYKNWGGMRFSFISNGIEAATSQRTRKYDKFYIKQNNSLTLIWTDTDGSRNVDIRAMNLSPSSLPPFLQPTSTRHAVFPPQSYACSWPFHTYKNLYLPSKNMIGWLPWLLKGQCIYPCKEISL